MVRRHRSRPGHIWKLTLPRVLTSRQRAWPGLGVSQGQSSARGLPAAVQMPSSQFHISHASLGRPTGDTIIHAFV